MFTVQQFSRVLQLASQSKVVWNVTNSCISFSFLFSVSERHPQNATKIVKTSTEAFRAETGKQKAETRTGNSCTTGMVILILNSNIRNFYIKDVDLYVKYKFLAFENPEYDSM